MHGRLWCPGVYGSRYQHTPERLVPAGTATPSHTANHHQVIMRDERYGPILIVRIECGGAASAPLPPPLPDPRREENRPLPAYTDPSMRYVAIYDTGPWTRSSASFLSRKAPANGLPSSPLLFLLVDVRILSFLPIYIFVIPSFRVSFLRSSCFGQVFGFGSA